MSDHRRDHGQFFTPRPLCRLAVAAALPGGGTRVLDPTCGDGRMLEAACEQLGGGGQVRGVEIDPAVAAQARESAPGATVLTASAFEGAVEPGWADAVVGNPPYVRYNVAAPVLAAAGGPIIDALRATHPRLSATRLATLAMRCALVDGDPERAQRWLARPDVAPADRRAWVQLAASWGARSDLSVPVWLLALRALRPGGRLAFVAADSPLSRAYGRWLRYAWLRWARPELVVLPGNAAWFPDAQVPVSLRVLQARQPDDCAPLGERALDGVLRVVQLEPQLRLDTPEGLSSLAPGCADPAEQARIAVEGIRTGAGPWSIREIPLQRLAGDLIDELEAAEPAALAAIEGRTQATTSGRPPLARLTPGLRWRRLTELGLQPRQGLRSGYNPFFYAERTGPDRVRLSPELGGEQLTVPERWLRPALRYQRELTSRSIDTIEARWVLLVTGAGLHPHDIAPYPRDWVEAWRAAGLPLLPPSVQRWIERARAHTVPRRGGPVPVPELSALAPNAKAPPLPDTPGAAPPAPPRGFYRLPIHPRHHAPIVLGRLVHMRPRPALNLGGRLIDANFSTMELAPGIDPHAVLALLSSTAAWAAFEDAGTPMGGGALKLEAAHLRQAWLPDVLDRPGLADLGRALVAATDDDTPDILDAIDAAILPDFGHRSALETRATQARDARQRRSR